MLRMQRRPAGFELDAARGGQRPREVQDPLNRVPHADRLGRQRQVARPAPRGVQDLVDGGQGAAPPPRGPAGTLALPRPRDVEGPGLGGAPPLPGAWRSGGGKPPPAPPGPPAPRVSPRRAIRGTPMWVWPPGASRPPAGGRGGRGAPPIPWAPPRRKASTSPISDSGK